MTNAQKEILKNPQQHYVARDLLEIKEEIGKLLDTQIENIIDQSNYIAKKNLGLIRYKASNRNGHFNYTNPEPMTYDEAVEFYHKWQGTDDFCIAPINDERGVEGPLYADGNHFAGYVNRIDTELEIACPRHYPRETVEQLKKELTKSK